MIRQEVRDFDGWRAAARPLLARAVHPEEVVWSDWRAPSLSDASDAAPPGAAGSPDAGASSHAGAPDSPPAPGAARSPAISRRLMRLLEDLACYRDPNRWELMYRLTWRVLHQNRDLLDNDADPDVQTARNWEKAIHRDVHKMHAFVRFHETNTGDGDKRYVAWFEPAHEILRVSIPFFEKCFFFLRWLFVSSVGVAFWF